MNKLFRHLIILQGENTAISKQLDYAICNLPGDWLTIAYESLLTTKHKNCFLPSQAKLLLGREFKHAIFDGRFGFNLDALAIVSGTLIAESLFILILPKDFTHWQDQDSLRWSELPVPLSVPNFITHLNTVILQQKKYYPDQFNQLAINDSQLDDHLSRIIAKDHWHINNHLQFDNHIEQQSLLVKLTQLRSKIVFITAKRGRGKSSLAGMFAMHNHCWVTAPNRNAVMALMRFAPKDTPYFSPDELIIQLPTLPDKPDWLIIDEAAMIPLPVIATLIDGFEHILLTSTLDGYEGTGQGLLLKLLTKYQQHHQVELLSLVTPIRWLENDPLEFFTDNLILANSSIMKGVGQQIDKIAVQKINQSELVEDELLLAEFFGLLKTAHYRTSLVDLRRLLDANNITLYCARTFNSSIVGVLVAIKEGGLEKALIENILKGYRRPKGNLVAQSLVAHAGERLAAELHSMRINRIAVNQLLRKQGVAKALLSHLIGQAKLIECDFISVSFAYSPEMCKIWSNLGFNIVHVGTHKEASSGSYAVMAIYPISSDGLKLCYIMQAKLARNWYWLKNIIDIDLPIIVDDDQSLNDRDKDELFLFASTSYSYSASFSVLYRLANWVSVRQPWLMMQLPLLLDLVKQDFCDKLVISDYQLSGKSELLVLLRKEVFDFMTKQESVNE
ncbi:GNAT family N-acetyltransferase [Orbus sturtevantii]|uniref:GNAT family N-acetyltransferase n=1 Tax=Orbus sturtevantii TaxID=3074109 RepID=UPI00370DBFE1